MKRPLTGLVVVLAAGIWAGVFLPVAPWPVWWAAVAGLVALVFWPRWLVLGPLVFTTGVLLLRCAVTPTNPTDLRRLVPDRDQNIELRGVVVSEPDSGSEDAPSRFVLRLRAARRVRDWQPAAGKVLVYAPWSGLRYGDEIECAVVLRVPAAARNPGMFDQQAWLARQRIYFIAVAAGANDCQVVARNQGQPLVALSHRLQDRLERALRAGLEDEPELAGVLSAIVIGQRAEIPPLTHADFQRTGVFHVFAVSGLHVGMVTLVVVLGLRLLQLPRRWCGLVAIPILAFYVYATGGRPGAVRALWMATAWLLSWVLVRPADLPTNLAAAALVILIGEPLALFDGGFVLSFGVVVALVVLTARFEKALGWVRLTDPLVPAGFVPWWRRRGDAMLTAVKRLAGGSAAAWLGMTPLLAAYFNLLTPIALIANLIVVPVIGLVMATGVAAMLAHPLTPTLAALCNNANFFFLAGLVRVVDALARVPYGHVFVQAPPLWLVAVYYLAGGVLLTRLAWRWRLAIVGTIAAGVVTWLALRETAVTVTVLDTPEGAAIFVDLPGEDDDWLFDGGGGNSGARVVLPFLRAQGVDRLGGVLLTCKDAGHVTGLEHILTELPVRAAVVGDSAARSPTYWRWRAMLNRQHLPVHSVKEGDHWETRGLRVTVLNPAPGADSQRSDDNSVVLLLEYGPTRLLLLSDVGATVEQRLLATARDWHCQVLIKGGHATEPSATPALLAAVRPAEVVQPVNAWPSRRHPDAALAQRVTDGGARLWRTDETGAITIRLTGKGYTVRPTLGPASRESTGWM